MTQKVNTTVQIADQEFSRDGNAFHLIGCWNKHARRQGWSKDDRNEVIKRAQSSDYDNLLQTLLSVTNLTSEED